MVVVRNTAGTKDRVTQEAQVTQRTGVGASAQAGRGWGVLRGRGGEGRRVVRMWAGGRHVASSPAVVLCRVYCVASGGRGGGSVG